MSLKKTELYRGFNIFTEEIRTGAWRVADPTQGRVPPGARPPAGRASVQGIRPDSGQGPHRPDPPEPAEPQQLAAVLGDVVDQVDFWFGKAGSSVARLADPPDTLTHPCAPRCSAIDTPIPVRQSPLGRSGEPRRRSAPLLPGRYCGAFR